jgi:RecJ-like exonuclease
MNHMRKLGIVFAVMMALSLCMVAQQKGAAHPKLDKHAAKGVACEACHGTAQPKAAPKTEQCSNCHGDYAKLRAATAKDNPNPHDLFHLGSGNVRCTVCHENHAESTLVCNKCHVESRKFNLKVP